MPAERDRGMPGFDPSRCHLGKKRLIGHVRTRVHDGHPRFPRPQLALQGPRRIQPGVPAAHDHYVLHQIPNLLMTSLVNA
jgi:hypothetical protein